MSQTPPQPAAPSPSAAAPSPAASAQRGTQADAVAAAIARARGAGAAAPATNRPATATPPPRTPAPASPAATPTATASPAPTPLAEGSVWKRFFTDWPKEIPPRGIVITQLNEAVPFKAFMLRDDVAMLQRPAPDAMGARFMFIPYGEIAVVKLTDPLKQPAFESGGFKGKMA